MKANPTCPSALCRTSGTCADEERCLSVSVIKLTTREERAAKADREYQEAARLEAVRMLEEALAVAKDTTGRRVTAVAVAFAYDNQWYGSFIPAQGDNIGLLIAALNDCLYRVIRDSNDDG